MAIDEKSRRSLAILPIRWRLLLLVAVPMLCVVVTVAVMEYRRMSIDARRTLTEQTRMSVRSLTRDLEKVILLDDRNAVTEIVGRLDSLQNIIYVVAYNESHHPVFRYQRDPGRLRATPSRVRDGDVVPVSEPVHHRGHVFGHVEVGVSREPLRKAQSDAIRWSLLIVAAIVLVAVLLAYLLQLFISRPITNLSTFVRTVADSESYDGARAHIDDRAELGTLRDGINYLLDCIVEREQSLRETIIALEAANEARSELMGHMNHEMRTPLSVIIGYCELIRDGDANANEGNDKLLDDLEQIHSAANQLLHLTNDLLDLSKLETGRMEIHRQPTDMRRFVGALMSQVRPLGDKRNNQLRTEVADDIGQIAIARGKVRQCLLNLLSNAAKFTDQGVITLSASRERWERPAELGGATEALVLRVTDTGIGMSAEQMDRIFQPFVQATPATSENFGGTGLGLAICKQYCEFMQGEITVDSALGKGSTFTIKLPI